MADVFIDGFAKYGPANSVSDTVVSLLTEGEWTSATTSGTGGAPITLSEWHILADLGGLGPAIEVEVACLSGNQSGGEGFLNKSLPGNYPRLIGGYKCAGPLTDRLHGILFGDGIGNPHLGIFLNSSGRFEVRSGGNSGQYPHTILDTSTASVSVNSVHQLQFDVTIDGSAGAYQVWLDGVSIIGPVTGVNTRGGSGANNYANTLSLVGVQVGTGQTLTIGAWSHLHLFDDTGGINDTVPLTDPIVDTKFASSDDAVAFTFGAGVLGQAYSTVSATNAPGANQLALRKFTPAVNCTLDSVSIMPRATSAGAKFKAAAYPDSGGSPNGQSLMSGGPEVVGCTSGAALVLDLTTPQSLTAGTPYWIGYLTDTSIVLAEVDTTITGVKASSTYGSGVPGTCPSVTTGQPSWEVYGNVSGVAVNWPQVAQSPPVGDLSYNTSGNNGDEDLFTFPALSSSPTVIYTVAVKANLRKSDAGARTVDLRAKSGATTDSGSDPGQSFGTTYSWLGSFFDVDPDTTLAWTESGLNSATSGYKIAS